MPRRDEELDDDTPIRRHTRKPDGPPVWLWWALGSMGLALIVVVIVLIASSGRRGGGEPSPTPIPAPASVYDSFNACCPACSKLFTISNEYKGNNSQYTVNIPCPRCGQEYPPLLLYGAANKVKSLLAKQAAGNGVRP